MSKLVRRGETAPDLAEWLQSIGVLREDGRAALPVLERCARCRATPGCGACPGCQAGQVCHHLPPCPECGAVQSVSLDQVIRHPLHRRLYGETPEVELFKTSNGVLFLQSVAALGIIEPVLGLEAEDDDETGAQPGSVLVLSGWRRVLAARACGVTTIPVRLVDPRALPRRADVDLVIVSANFQRQKTIDELRGEIQVWKKAIAQASPRQPKPWELRMVVAKVMGISVRQIEEADAASATERLSAAERRLGLASPGTTEPAEDEAELTGDDLSMIARLRQEMQPGDLRGSDILSALTERDEPLLSEERDQVVHESLGRAAQAAEGTFILDVEEVAPFWPVDAPEETPNGRDAQPRAATGATGPRTEREAASSVARVGNLTVHRGSADALPFVELPAVDLIVAAPSWIEPLVRPFLTPAHVPFVRDWQDRLRACLGSWRQAIHPGGRLLLIVPVSTPLHPGLPLLAAAIDELRATDWAIGGTLVLDDPGLHGPLYAVPHPDQVLAPKGPARLIITAAPVLAEAEGSIEERWRQSWAAPLSGRQPREVATVEEAALSHLWKYAGPGRRSRWLPEFQPGLLYHLVRIFSRPDATVFLPELGGANLVRGCLRAGRPVIALAELSEQIEDVVERLRRDLSLATDASGESGFALDSLTAVTGGASPESASDDD
ncbi:MAG: hypothetical protein ACRDIY_13230 [Chloroflexota bacterium]